MITYNEVTPLAPRLRTYTKAFKEALVSYLEFKKGHSDVCLSGVEVLDRADGILQAMEKQEAAIAADSRLSTLGKQEAVAKVAVEVHQQLRFVGAAAKDRRNTAERLQQTFAAVPEPQDQNPVTDYLRGSEIRQRLSALAQSERMKAVQDGSPAVLRAVLMDPIGEPLVDRAFLERLQNDRAKATDNGKEWVRKESLLFVAERLDQLATAIDLQLLNYNALPSFPGQPTRKTDLAYTDITAPPDKSKAVDKPPTTTPVFQ